MKAPLSTRTIGSKPGGLIGQSGGGGILPLLIFFQRFDSLRQSVPVGCLRDHVSALLQAESLSGGAFPRRVRGISPPALKSE